MHIFLTGEIQQGKSTIISRLMQTTGIVPVGFKTISGPLEKDGSSSVHMIPADGSKWISDDNIIFHRHGHRGRKGVDIFDKVFDTLGVSLLKDTGRPLVIMDELGTKETGAKAFQRAVLCCLDSQTPILGVVQKRESAFLDQVRSHPKVQMINVDTGNRNDIYEMLLPRYMALTCGK